MNQRCVDERDRCAVDMMTISSYGVIGLADWEMELKILQGKVTHEQIVERLKQSQAAR